MRSPGLNPTPSIDLQGASRVTGGILHGRAQGNVFNNADADIALDPGFKHCVGQVQVYTTYADPAITKPHMELKHQVTPKLQQVLRVLSRKYSPVCHMVYISYVDVLKFYISFFF